MSAIQRRLQLVKTTKKYGLHVQPKALQAMLQYDETSSEALDPILICLQEKMTQVNPKIITPELWEEALQEAVPKTATSTSTVTKKGGAFKAESNLSRSLSQSHSAARPKVSDWRIIDAFDTPALVYDSLRQQFHYAANETRPSLFGTVEDKIDMMSQRFLRVQQRVSRTVPVLTSIDRLLGTSATSLQTLLGLLHATSTSAAMAEAEGGVATGFELEDLTGSIPLQLHSGTKLDSSGVYTDGCAVMVEGYYDEGIFVVEELKLPSIESKKKSKPFMPPVPSRCSASHSISSTPLTVYTMVNVAVDEPEVFQQLQKLVAALCEEPSRDQVILALMGNFTTSNSVTLPVALAELSRVLEPLPSNHKVLILPGPNDSPSMCWPLPPIKAPSSFASDLKADVDFVSNPCRIQYGEHQDILLYRHDIIQQNLQNEILSVRRTGYEEGKQAMSTRILHTVLSQGHILPNAPIYWNYDHALSVYPLPDVVLLGLEEGEADPISFKEAGCQVLAPGSQGKWGKVTLYPKHKRSGLGRPVEVDFFRTTVDEDDEDSIDSGFDSMEEE
mmetsp:Transcript_9293/g.26710  ORF Transcript_9293/g.26710 Transcript_9293/m.26710 type:complete len:559 (+) Transcript_9293:162-1838(+)|eukprot:CAMPEP_0176022598 /NCGR_PEP_ID=MMETSP0120_2-20121206/11004_1 /TAXON_ID=160619 /ORGANISM="Kryptoperidinium foliaceum, Strain CCMP 1326" /LENGTH=558 /DNA_ID=CAMNT_0017355741 /DNA_START=114 /DNA_END=1790 /DNA_ORIENTATION=-